MYGVAVTAFAITSLSVIVGLHCAHATVNEALGRPFPKGACQLPQPGPDALIEGSPGQAFGNFAVIALGGYVITYATLFATCEVAKKAFGWGD